MSLLKIQIHSILITSQQFWEPSQNAKRIRWQDQINFLSILSQLLLSKLKIFHQETFLKFFMLIRSETQAIQSFTRHSIKELSSLLITKFYLITQQFSTWITIWCLETIQIERFGNIWLTRPCIKTTFYRSLTTSLSNSLDSFWSTIFQIGTSASMLINSIMPRGTLIKCNLMTTRCKRENLWKSRLTWTKKYLFTLFTSWRCTTCSIWTLCSTTKKYASSITLKIGDYHSRSSLVRSKSWHQNCSGIRVGKS